MIARRLNAAGIARFRAFLATARAGSTEAPPRALLEDAQCTSELAVDLPIAQTSFPSRLHLGAYLVQALARLPRAEVDSDAGLWSWLALHWFDQLCPPRADGGRRPGVDHRHVADFSYRTRYRHLLYGPYLVYRRHGAMARVLLTTPPHVEGVAYRDITSVQDLIANRGVIEAASLLYLDARTQRLKPGCQSSQASPGTIRRLVRVLAQLDLTHDVLGMSGQQIVDILPAEFDGWRPGARAGDEAAAVLRPVATERSGGGARALRAVRRKAQKR